VRQAAKLHQFQPRDIERVCETLSCSRAQLGAKLGVSRACVSRWEKGLRAPQGGDAARLRAWLGKDTGTVVDVFDLRAKLGMTQRVFGAQFGVSRQQVQKWETARRRRSAAISTSW
jgi:DNA-binding transcriptional regulator YiaG